MQPYLSKTLLYLFFSLVLVSPLYSQDQANQSVTADTTTGSVATEVPDTPAPSAPSEILKYQPTLTVETKLQSSSVLLDYRLPFTEIFKYDTSPNNPEHRCYDINKPLTNRYSFLFNFMSQQKYMIGDH
ncbi:MAG: hypothetical protein ACE5G1_13570 [bacterium]